MVNALAGWNNVLPVQTVFEAWGGALTVLLRMLWGVSRRATSPQRVGCDLLRDYPGRIVHFARQRAGGNCASLPSANKRAFGLELGAGSRRFFQKKVYYGGAPGLNPRKLTLILFLSDPPGGIN